MTAPRRSARAALLVVLALGAVGFGPSSDEPEALPIDFVDLTRHPTVRVVFRSPPGLEGRVIEPGMVEVLEAGEPQQARLTSIEAESIVAVLVMDLSGSMEGAPLVEATAAAIGFVDRMPDDSDIALIAFGTGVQVVSEFGSSRDDLRESIRGLELAGNTALNDALIAAADLIGQRPEVRKLIILLTDGGDTVSVAPRSAAIGALSALDVVFYAIELQGAGLDSAALAELTAAADGQVIEADDAVALAEIYDAIATQVVSQHIVEYDTTRSGATVLDVLVTVDGVTYASSMTLQLPSSSDAPAPASTTPGASTPTTPPAAGPQPPIAIAPAPGVLGEAWTLAAGVVLLGFTLFIVTSFALSTDGGRRRLSLLDDEHAGEDNILKRIYRRLSAAIEATFARSSRAKGLAHSLDAAGIALKPGEFALLVALAVMGALGVGLASGEPMRGLLLAVVAGVLPRLLISRRAGKRRRAFGDQLDGTLQLLAGSLRAGYGLTQALDAVAAESPTPTSDEFGRVVVETRLGRDFTDSLTALARRMESNDMRWVAEAIGIQREVGGDLAEVLDTLAETIRERSQIRRQVHALSAEGRISAVILIALPLVLALVISIINPLYLADLTGTSIGRTLIIVAVVLMVVGVIWLRRIIKVVF